MLGLPWTLVPVLVLALAHGLFFVLLIPPWDLYDEGTHLSYALVLRDEHRIPHLEEHTRQDVVDAEIEADRWNRFQIGEPDTSSLEAMGLGGRLYQGYQPPLYYLVIIPMTYFGRDVPETLYAARMSGPVLLVALTALSWILASLWFPRGGIAVRATAATLVALTPAAASAAGRVNNDLLAAVLIVAGIVSATYLVNRPAFIYAAAFSVVTVLAVLAKSHGLLLLPIGVVALLLLWQRRMLSVSILAITLLPGVLTAGLWAVWTYNRYGVWTGTEAFLAFARPFEPLSVWEFVHAILFNTWSSYWATYDGGVLERTTGVVLFGVVLTGVGALLIRRSAPFEALVFSAVMVIGFLALLWYGNVSGLVYPQGRILLPVLPVASVLTVAGWQSLPGRYGVIMPLVIGIVASLAFTSAWFVPFFHG